MSEASDRPPVQRAYIVRGLPRRVLPDLAWLGGCSNSAGWPGPAALRRPITHEPCVAYLILGARKTVMLDTGHFAHWHSLAGQIEEMLQGRSLDYVFVSHQEIPHTGNLGRLLQKYPQAKAVGDVDAEMQLRRMHVQHVEALRRLEKDAPGIQRESGDVIPRRAAEQALVGYASSIKASLQLLPSRIFSLFPDLAAEVKEAVLREVEGIQRAAATLKLTDDAQPG